MTSGIPFPTMTARFLGGPDDGTELGMLNGAGTWDPPASLPPRSFDETEGKYVLVPEPVAELTWTYRWVPASSAGEP